MPLVSFPQPLSADRLPKEPSPQQAADCTQLPGFPSAPHQCQRTLSRVVAAYSPPKVSFLRKGANAPQKSRACPLRSDSGEVDRSEAETLDFFHPPFKTSTYRAFSESPDSLFFLLFPLGRACPSSPGIAPHSMILLLSTSLSEV